MRAFGGMNYVPPACSHHLSCGKSARTAPLYHCSACGKPPAILGVLPFTKKEEEFLATRDLARKAVKVMA